jgi:hypothetical protein
MASQEANAINAATTGIVGNTGTAFTGTAVTQYNVVVGGSTTSSLSNVAPSATSGVPLISQGASANPAFGTAVVAGGGTGAVTLTGVLIGNGTSSVTGNTVTQYDVLVGGASNAISSVGPGTSGQVLQSGGNAANPAYSTATYPATTTINQLLYSSAANTVGGVTAGNYGVLISGATGIPSWLADGTTGQLLTATTAGTPSWANAAASSVTITGDTGGGLTGNSFTFTGGTTGLKFGGAGSTETVSGTLIVSNGGTGATTLTGLVTGSGTSALTATAITQYNVLTGGVSNAPNSVAPSATSGVPLISQGAASQPVFGTAVVAGGGTGAVTLTGLLTGNGTSAITGTAITQYNVITGGATNAPNSVAPSATSGVPLISQGSSAQPVFGTTVVAGGGTGDTSFTAYAPVCGGTTTTGALQSATTGIGTSGFVLTSTGSSSLPTWQAVGVPTFQVNNQVFTSTGTYTPTSGMVYCSVQCLGGGGGGGAGTTTNSVTYSGGGGGGSGEYAVGIFSSASIGASKAVTIGAAGAGGTSGNQGSTGGTSSLGVLITAIGGTGGLAGGAGGGGGAGGTGGTGGDYRTPGQYGNNSLAYFAGGLLSFGQGAGSQLGASGGSSGQNTTGTAGLGYGAGGSGAFNTQSQTGSVGGAGTKGIVIVTEYIT